jgi:Ran GTPase-activating protein (RanGAP) involved in mRNA processing and transport
MLNRGNVLETFVLNGNQLRDEGVKTVMRSLKASQTLRILELAKNEITADLCHFLAKYLKSNNTITALNLADNKV